MNGLAELVQCFVHLGLCVLDGLVGRIDRVGQQIKAFLDWGGETAAGQFNSLRLQKVTKVMKEFVFLDGLHGM